MEESRARFGLDRMADAYEALYRELATEYVIPPNRLKAEDGRTAPTL